MSREYLEAFGRITLHTEYDNDSSYDCVSFEDDCKLVDNALQRLESIDNSRPSEALECLEKIDDMFYLNKYRTTDGGNKEEYEFYPRMTKEYDVIENFLLKAQEQEKEKLLFKNIHNTKVKTPLVAIFEGLSKEERFKFTEHIYYHWEEMKEELEDKISSLKKELEQALIQGENNRIKLEKSEKIISRLIDKKSKKEIALDIIKKKCFNNDNLAILSDFDDYPRYISHFELSVGPKAILGYHVKEEDLLDENEYNILVEFFKNDKKGESAA